MRVTRAMYCFCDVHKAVNGIVLAAFRNQGTVATFGFGSLNYFHKLAMKAATFTAASVSPATDAARLIPSHKLATTDLFGFGFAN